MAHSLELLIIHCTDTPAKRNVSAAEIRAWHTKKKPYGRGWKQVGYADMIHLNGTLTNLVPYNDDDLVDAWEITNGVRGHNHHARHVVYVGGRTEEGNRVQDTRTAAQRIALANYVRQTIAQHPQIRVAGHNQFDPHKQCPSFQVPQWLRAIGIDWKNIYHQTDAA